MTHRISKGRIEELRRLFTDKSQVISPGSAGYDQSLKRWSELASLPAGVVVFPESADDVSKAVYFCRKHSIDLAVKGGGNSPDGGNSSDGGLVIDLSRMKGVSIHPETNIVSVQGGALWADVHEATSKSDLVVLTSTVGTTGVGGVTLQGGYGHLIGVHGLIIDNLRSARVVVADGQVLTVSDTENADLFWAIRGAGQNFGVVVEFTFQAYKRPNSVFAGILVFTLDKTLTVLKSLNATLDYKDGKAAAQCIFSKPPDRSELLVTVVLYYGGPESECRERFVDLFRLEKVSANMKMMPYEQANTLLDSFSPAGGRKRLIGFSFATPLRPEFVQGVLDELKLKFEAEPDLNQSFLELEFLNMSKVCQVPTTAMAFPSRAMTQKGSIALQYQNPDKDEAYFKWSMKVQGMFQEEFQRAGYNPKMLVSNFNYITNPSSKTTPSAMFGANAQKLVELKKKYDPEQLFHKFNPISV
ncbi:hypothetical protein BDW71DRAFT_211204 [Aspergillus fruticulosus]